MDACGRRFQPPESFRRSPRLVDRFAVTLTVDRFAVTLTVDRFAVTLTVDRFAITHIKVQIEHIVLR